MGPQSNEQDCRFVRHDGGHRRLKATFRSTTARAGGERLHPPCGGRGDVGRPRGALRRREEEPPAEGRTGVPCGAGERRATKPERRGRHDGGGALDSIAAAVSSTPQSRRAPLHFGMTGALTATSQKTRRADKT